MTGLVAVTLAALVLTTLAGCAGSENATTVTRTVTVAAEPAPPEPEPEEPEPAMPASFKKAVQLAKHKRSGEIVLSKDGAGSYGPFRFNNGIYRVRFQQFTTDPADVDFANEASSLVVQMHRRPGEVTHETVHVFNATRGAGETQITAQGGRYFVDISSGDYPVVLRFTPR